MHYVMTVRASIAIAALRLQVLLGTRELRVRRQMLRTTTPCSGRSAVEAASTSTLGDIASANIRPRRRHLSSSIIWVFNVRTIRSFVLY
jgi:hypothetical protein